MKAFCIIGLEQYYLIPEWNFVWGYFESKDTSLVDARGLHFFLLPLTSLRLRGLRGLPHLQLLHPMSKISLHCFSCGVNA